MKVRISGNSIRFRLKEPEVIHFGKTGKITDEIHFGPDEASSIKFILEKSPVKILSASFSNNTIIILIPENIAGEWTNTSLVGIEDKVNGESLSVLIEKDFACLDKSVGDNEGTYPNPLARKEKEDAD